ncbi:DUF6281 family protein [Streptomyces sp. T12]|uniref:DUF6281 family protein n=2 Tax=unclassified Streptomyces TaxID=2593676 RepID=UPI002365691B|nr:DUF6281 family protein [Streptomyces sp. T12]WDF40804.1 DUF6281 family protein [Streptomyces sp. T12]
MTALLLTAAVGCAESGGAGGTAAASCAYVVTYDSRSYLDAGNLEFTVGEKLGSATLPACDAIAVGDTAAEARLVKVR